MSKMISTVKGLVLISFLMVLTGVMSTNAQTVSSFGGGIDGAGGIAVDSLGNMYVSEWRGHSIITITPNGAQGTFAGTYKVPGYADGPAASAKFSFPTGLTVDLANNVYVIDSGNKRIRRITPSGVVSTVKDFSALGSAPSAIVADRSFNLFYFHNQVLYKLSPNGTDTIVAGRAGCNDIINGTGTAACFVNPLDLAKDSNTGNLYTLEGKGAVVRKISPTYEVTELGDRGKFLLPLSIAVDSASGDVYVGTNGQINKIYKVTKAGVISLYTGTGVAGSNDGDVKTATFKYPAALAFRINALYVADYYNGVVRKIQ